MPSKILFPVILCGGSGTRLWPLSRKSFPKQFISIFDDKYSLLQLTEKRIQGLKNIHNPILICNESHRFIVAEQMREVNIKPHSIILEPFGRNTAPAICMAALRAIEKDSDAILIILSSDHSIKNVKRFLEVVEHGIKFVEEDNLVAFGIVPSRPETGYGYIKSEKAFNIKEINGIKISKFIEKPNFRLAKEFIKDKRFTWNSGMFMFKAKVILDEINKYHPKIYTSCLESIKGSKKDLDFERIDNEAFKNCPDVSIDIAVMEKTSRGIVLPLDVGWTDIGSWKSVWENSEKDFNGNYSKGKVLIKDSKNSYFRSEDRLIVGLGLEDLLVIETNDAVLIANKNQDQKVKDIVLELKEKKIPEGISHKKVFRPWGNYISLVEGKRWQVKQISVHPGEKLSLQFHHHRAEHWVVVKGTAEVEIDSNTKILGENQSIYIPIGSKHRLYNPGKITLILIEVQSGSYLGEDDIIRIEDVYGR